MAEKPQKPKTVEIEIHITPTHLLLALLLVVMVVAHYFLTRATS